MKQSPSSSLNKFLKNKQVNRLLNENTSLSGSMKGVVLDSADALYKEYVDANPEYKEYLDENSSLSDKKYKFASQEDQDDFVKKLGERKNAAISRAGESVKAGLENAYGMIDQWRGGTIERYEEWQKNRDAYVTNALRMEGRAAIDVVRKELDEFANQCCVVAHNRGCHP